MHFCNQRKQNAESSFMVDKHPVKLVTEGKFLGVVFVRTLSYTSHVNYLQTNCLRALEMVKVLGHADWGADRKTTLP